MTVLLVDAQQQVVGVYDGVKKIPAEDRSEGDSIIKTKKAAIEANLGEHWPTPVKVAKDPDAPKVERAPIPTTGAYTVKEGFAPKSKEGNEGRNVMFEVLFAENTVEGFLANAVAYEFNGKKVTPQSCLGYVLRKGMIVMA
jgi:hypothetical protein